jgi:ElaB/YqjD/DUF883 family membrane-anchored ribosome-binding protein
MNSAKANDLRDSASDKLDQFQRAADPAIKQGKQRAGELLDQGGELIDSVTSRVSDTAVDLAKSLVAYTKKNPLAAILLAIGAGALLISAAKSIQARR